MKATFLNPFGVVLNALKASWIVKLAAVFAVGVPVSVAVAPLQPRPVPYECVSDGYVSSASYRLGYNSDTNIAMPGENTMKLVKVGLRRWKASWPDFTQDMSLRDPLCGFSTIPYSE